MPTANSARKREDSTQRARKTKPSGRAGSQVAPARSTAKALKGPKEPLNSRSGKRLISGFFDPGTHTRFKVMATMRGSTIQEMLERAVMDALEKYGQVHTNAKATQQAADLEPAKKGEL